jgi:excisionase family DNA binding protein
MEKSQQDFDVLEAVTVQEAATLLHVSRPTVEKYIKAGQLPSVLLGRCRRIRRVELAVFLERRTAYGWQPYHREPAPIDAAPGERPPPGGDDIPY